MTFWETVERGEYVMIALCVIFIAITVVWCVRASRLRSQRRSYAPMMHRVKDYVMESDIDNARQLCTSIGTPGALAVLAGLRRIGRPMPDVREAMQETLAAEKEKMARGAVWLRALAVISPLLGLGGTLIGVIDRLRYLAEHVASADTAILAGEIAPTIVTTVAGLGVGIYALVALTCLNSEIITSRNYLDRTALDFTDLLEQPC